MFTCYITLKNKVKVLILSFYFLTNAIKTYTQMFSKKLYCTYFLNMILLLTVIKKISKLFGEKIIVRKTNKTKMFKLIKQQNI